MQTLNISSMKNISVFFLFKKNNDTYNILKSQNESLFCHHLFSPFTFGCLIFVQENAYACMFVWVYSVGKMFAAFLELKTKKIFRIWTLNYVNIWIYLLYLFTHLHLCLLYVSLSLSFSLFRCLCWEIKTWWNRI